MTPYYDQMRELIQVASIYSRQEPVRAPGEIRPLTKRERRQVDRLSTERGYRRFTAEVMTSV